MSRLSSSRYGARASVLALSASLFGLAPRAAYAQTPPVPTAATPAAPASGSVKKEKPLSDAQKQKRAREAFASGEKKAAAGDYAGALDDFRASDAASSTPQSRYRIALTLDKLGKATEAVELYQKVVAEPAAEGMADARAAATARIDELSTGSLAVTSMPTGAKLVVDGAEASSLTPATLRLHSGKHTIEASILNYEPLNREVTVLPGASSDLKLELSPKPPPAPPPVAAAAQPATPSPAATAPPPRGKLPAYVTLGLAGAGALVGTMYGVKALSAKKDYDRTPTANSADGTERDALIADMAFGAAITLGFTGVVLLVSDEEQPAAPKTSLRITPIAGPHTQGASALLSF